MGERSWKVSWNLELLASEHTIHQWKWTWWQPSSLLSQHNLQEMSHTVMWFTGNPTHTNLYLNFSSHHYPPTSRPFSPAWYPWPQLCVTKSWEWGGSSRLLSGTTDKTRDRLTGLSIHQTKVAWNREDLILVMFLLVSIWQVTVSAGSLMCSPAVHKTSPPILFAP